MSQSSEGSGTALAIVGAGTALAGGAIQGIGAIQGGRWKAKNLKNQARATKRFAAQTLDLSKSQATLGYEQAMEGYSYQRGQTERSLAQLRESLGLQTQQMGSEAGLQLGDSRAQQAAAGGIVRGGAVRQQQAIDQQFDQMEMQEDQAAENAAAEMSYLDKQEDFAGRRRDLSNQAAQLNYQQSMYKARQMKKQAKQAKIGGMLSGAGAILGGVGSAAGIFA